MRILLLGGSKSGKSMLGQRLARQLADGGPMIYWATLEPRDGEDRAIVRRHLAEREGWGFQTLERGRELPRGLAAVPPESAVLFDSVTACLACQMFSGPSPDAAAPERTAEELLAITKLTAKKKGYTIDETCETPLLQYYEKRQATDARTAGNGRLVRNLVEDAILNQSRRLTGGDVTSLTEAELAALLSEDFDLSEG